MVDELERLRDDISHLITKIEALDLHRSELDKQLDSIRIILAYCLAVVPPDKLNAIRAISSQPEQKHLTRDLVLVAEMAATIRSELQDR